MTAVAIVSDTAGHFIDERCPKCGAPLLGNAQGDKWCSFVGGQTNDGKIAACDYGLRRSARGAAKATNATLTARELAKEMVSALRRCPASPERAKHILRMVRIAEGNATPESLGSPFNEAANFCEANGVR